MKLWKRRPMFKSPEEEERFKWAIIGEDLKLIRCGEKPTFDEVKKRFEEKLYPKESR